MERKEAIEVVKKNWPDSSFTMLREALETLIPELKESEDEKIKEDLIEWISDFPDMIWSGHYKKDVIAWLEKQGEQKPANKSDLVLNILNKENQEVQQGDLIKKPSLINVGENEMVLSDVISILDNGFMPSSMERARLVKGLQSIKSQSNPAWSEEDKKSINEIEESLLAYKIIVMDNDRELANYIEKEINWLKSLKDKYTWKPSEEQMKILNEVLNFAANHESPHWNDYIFGTLNNLMRQLKKLREE